MDSYIPIPAAGVVLRFDDVGIVTVSTALKAAVENGKVLLLGTRTGQLVLNLASVGPLRVVEEWDGNLDMVRMVDLNVLV